MLRRKFEGGFKDELMSVWLSCQFEDSFKDGVRIELALWSPHGLKLCGARWLGAVQPEAIWLAEMNQLHAAICHLDALQQMAHP